MRFLVKIVILAMDDPLYTNRFIKQIIDVRHDDIAGKTPRGRVYTFHKKFLSGIFWTQIEGLNHGKKPRDRQH